MAIERVYMRAHEEGNLVNAPPPPPRGRDTPVIIGVGEIITRVHNTHTQTQTCIINM